jgi:hypothetical protein
MVYVRLQTIVSELFKLCTCNELFDSKPFGFYLDLELLCD